MKYIIIFLILFNTITHAEGILDSIKSSEDHIKASKQVFQSNDFDEQVLGIQYLTKEAEEGSAYATGKLGWAYQQGLGVEKDLAKAIELYETAANAGMTYWQILLAHAHQQGYLGFEKSFEKYEHWFNVKPKVHNADYSCWVSNYYKNGIFPNDVELSTVHKNKCESHDSNINK